MLDKYPDYPLGISEKNIADSDITQITRIIEIYTNEFLLAVNRETKKSEELSEQINRYAIFSNLLTNSLKSWDSTELSDSEKILQGSIFLGSMLEGSLQLFLFVFKEDYLKAMWKKWNKIDDEGNITLIDIKEIKSQISNLLNQFVSNKIINTKQKNNLKDAIYDELKIRESGKNIDRIMLDELIRLFEHEKILGKYDDEDLALKNIISKMDDIKNGRNSVHIFTKAPLSSEEEFFQRLRNYCFIMKDLLFRVQCCDEDERKEAMLEHLLEIPDSCAILIDDDNNIFKVLGNFNLDKNEN